MQMSPKRFEKLRDGLIKQAKRKAESSVMFYPIKNRDYIQGDGPAKITKLTNSDGLLTIEGENFVEKDKVYLNDKTMNFAFVSPNKLTAILPNDLSSDP